MGAKYGTVVHLIRDEIILWNHKYPIDLFWRRKYKVAFGSKEHLDMTFLDMRIDFEEEIMIMDQDRKAKRIESGEKELDDMLGIPEIEKMSAKEIDKEFEELDITKFYQSPEEKPDGEEKVPI